MTGGDAAWKVSTLALSSLCWLISFILSSIIPKFNRKMATSIDTRRVKLTARAADSLKSAALVGQQTPYLEITIGRGSSVTTNADEKSPENPVWDQSFEIELPGAEPGEGNIILTVVAKNKITTPLMPDTTIGRGSVPLAQLFSTGKEEARIPLHDSNENPAGVAFIGVEVILPEEHREIRKLKPA